MNEINIAHESLLKFGKVNDGIQKVELDIQELYRDDQEKFKKFKQKLDQFLKSDPCNSKVIDKFLNEGMIRYRTECIIPSGKENSHRVPILLLLGNPASHSVFSEMIFAYEADGREHRFWKALKDAGILSFKTSSNKERKKNYLM